VATLWAVNDRPTSRLITRFYQAARTRPLPEALAHVQRVQAHGGGPDSDPWAWAPFVMVVGGG
jgi:CHAT domain-containing protein